MNGFHFEFSCIYSLTFIFASRPGGAGRSFMPLIVSYSRRSGKFVLPAVFDRQAGLKNPGTFGKAPGSGNLCGLSVLVGWGVPCHLAGEWPPELELGLPEAFSGVEAGLCSSLPPVWRAWCRSTPGLSSSLILGPGAPSRLVFPRG